MLEGLGLVLLGMALAGVGAAAIWMLRERRRMSQEFQALSAEALRDNREDFIRNAKELLAPVSETLTKVQDQLQKVDGARQGSEAKVTTQIQSLKDSQELLRKATEGLSQALRSPNARGRWGEIQLRRIVELAGMLEHCDFTEKASTTNEDGSRQTPDMIITLPGDVTVVLDSKVPITGYLEAVNAKDEKHRAEALQTHARQVRDHIKALSGKEYWKQFEPAPEFVIMFLPLEPLLSAAFEEDGTLLDLAANLKVIPATPLTLLALLKAIAQGWRQQQLAKNAEEIQAVGRELYDRLATALGHLDEVGTSLRDAAESYDKFVGSLEQKVLPGARRFKELGVGATKDLGEPRPPLNIVPRPVKKDDPPVSESPRSA